MAKRPKQEMIPGTEPVSIPQIETVAEEYRDLRNRRMELLEMEIEAAKGLLSEMKEHGLETYEYDGFIVQCKPVEKVSVRRKPGAKDEGGDE